MGSNAVEIVAHDPSSDVRRQLGTSPSLGMGDLNPYQVLGVRPDANDEEIRAAFRRLAKELHPDLHQGDEATERRFRAVLAAYETFKHTRPGLSHERGAAAETVSHSGYNSTHRVHLYGVCRVDVLA